jgi:4'-phosphopantetheinyl transferase
MILHQRDERGMEQLQPLDLPAQDELHLWQLDLTGGVARWAVACGWLTPEELARGQRYLRVEIREQFIACRSLLRALLSRYIAVPPQAVALQVSPYGKPQLAPGQGNAATAELQFNVSHSHGQALIAVARRRQVGVDIEVHRPLTDLPAIVRRYFSPADQAVFARLPPAEQEQAFFRGWVCKEAFGKAVGRGLTAGLDQVNVLADDPGEAACGWSWCDWSLGVGRFAAVCVEGAGVQFRWPSTASTATEWGDRVTGRRSDG